MFPQIPVIPQTALLPAAPSVFMTSWYAHLKNLNVDRAVPPRRGLLHLPLLAADGYHARSILGWATT
ncbi:MAG: hypothetical protein C0522_09500 [Rhodocyclaceae bacterium]|jgi:hypothetical protein|nr:hypothetical protein [Rhodocyclaceae bacterium]